MACGCRTQTDPAIMPAMLVVEEARDPWGWLRRWWWLLLLLLVLLRRGDG